ncbi:unnamed protein product, partial [Dibothriocephalus latus]
MCMIGTIFREGIIASLTGGFFLDPSQGYVVSCIHMYLWLYFFIVPLAITLIKPQSIIAWTVYSVTVVLLVGIIQYLTYRLHKTFDECEPIPQATGFYSDVCSAEATENLKERTYDPTGSALSLDSTCLRTATNVYASVENIEAQCRRIGLAGQCLAGVRMIDNRQDTLNEKPQSTSPIAYLNCSNRDKVGNLEEHGLDGSVNESPDDGLALLRTDTDPYSNLEEANTSAQTVVP